MTYQWCKSQFTADELNGKSVEFTIPLDVGGTATGIGTLEAKQNPQGLIAVRIIQQFLTHKDASVQMFFVPVEDMPKLVRNPEGSQCEFSINAL